MQTGLITHIRKYVTITDEEAAIISSYARPLAIKKKNFLLKEGQVCKANYFVEKGCLRLVFTDEKGAEQTAQFAIENWWLTDYISLYNAAPSRFWIQAVENSAILAFEKAGEDALFARVPVLERYFRILLEKSYGASQWRIKLIFGLSKEEMYKQFNASFPEFVQRVPQYMLASFLGFTPEYLSEIRKKRP